MKEFYDRCVLSPNGCYTHKFEQKDLAKMIAQFTDIHLSSIREHRKVLSVKLDQSDYALIVTVFGNKLDKFITPEVDESEIIDVEPKINPQWSTPAVDMTLKNEKWVEDCKTPEDCEDGCEGNCPEAFEGDNLT